MTYKKVKRGEPAFGIIAVFKKAKIWVCDSEDHNDPKGCSNPQCFKYNKS